MQSGAVLVGAAVGLLFWYALWKQLSQRLLGMDPHRIHSDQRRRSTPAWVLTAAHTALMIGVSPLFGYTLVRQYGNASLLLWALLGAALLAAPAQVGLLWLAARQGGQGNAAPALANSRGGRRFLALAGWLLCVLAVAVLADTVAAGLDASVQQVQPKEYLVDEAGYLSALAAGPDGGQAELLQYADQAALEAAQTHNQRRAGQRSEVAAAMAALLVLAILLGRLIFGERKAAWRWVPVVLVLFGLYWLWSSGQAVLVATRKQWLWWLLLYTAAQLFLPTGKLSLPRDVLVGVLAGGMALLALVGGLLGTQTIEEPLWQGLAQGEMPLLPLLATTMLAGGANVLGLFASPRRYAHRLAKEQHAYAIGGGGTLLAGFIGMIFAVAAVTYHLAPVAAEGVYSGPREIMDGVALMMARTGLPLDWAALWVTVVCVGCALSGLETAARLGTSLLHGVLAPDAERGVPFAPERLYAVLLTMTGAAALVLYTDYWSLWPYFGALSTGLCGLALWQVSGWLSRAGRGYMWLAVPAAMMMVLSVAALVLLGVQKFGM